MFTVIYGGSGGIGSALARRVAAMGANINLVARDPVKLKAVATEIGATVTVGDVMDPSIFARVAADVPGPVTGFAYAVGSTNLRPVAGIWDTIEPCSDRCRDTARTSRSAEKA